jgi:hypothetical protein
MMISLTVLLLSSLLLGISGRPDSRESGSREHNHDLNKYLKASDKAARFFQQHLSEDGQLFGESEADVYTDLAYYYKLPTLLLESGKVMEANLVLNYVKDNFLQDNGDFMTSSLLKTDNFALNDHYAYTNGWLQMGSQRVGRFDVAQPAAEFTQSFYNPSNGGWTTNAAYGGNNIMDMLTVSHFGLAALYFGNMDHATAAGDVLKNAINSQPNLGAEFFIRMNGDGSLITNPDDFTVPPFHVISNTAENPLLFFAGYPIAYLAKLSAATGDESYLAASRTVLDFVLSCDDSKYSFYYSHKAAWASSIVAGLTNEQSYVDFATRVADYLVSLQAEDGSFTVAQDNPMEVYDQTAEIGVWLREIYSELSNM